jgi:hypothetical protein
MLMCVYLGRKENSGGCKGFATASSIFQAMRQSPKCATACITPPDQHNIAPNLAGTEPYCENPEKNEQISRSTDSVPECKPESASDQSMFLQLPDSFNDVALDEFDSNLGTFDPLDLGVESEEMGAAASVVLFEVQDPASFDNFNLNEVDLVSEGSHQVEIVGDDNVEAIIQENINVHEDINSNTDNGAEEEEYKPTGRKRLRLQVERIEKEHEKQPITDSCSEANCRRKCTSKIPKERREVIWKSYWSLDYNQRKTWLFHNVERAEKVKPTTGAHVSRRNLTFTYKLKDSEGQKQSVCKTF